MMRSGGKVGIKQFTFKNGEAKINSEGGLKGTCEEKLEKQTGVKRVEYFSLVLYSI